MTHLEAHTLVNLNKLSTPNPPACYKCGKIGHTPSKCRCKEGVCHNCGKKGHITAACRGGAHNQHQRAPLFPLEYDVPAAILVDRDIHFFSCFLVDVLIEGKRLSMEVDTGVAMSAISESTESFSTSNTLKDSSAIADCHRRKFPLVGMVQVKVSYKKQAKSLILCVQRTWVLVYLDVNV